MSNSNNTKSIFAERLALLMKDRGVTQSVLSDAAGVTRQAISQYVTGEVQPNAEKIYKICKYFNVSADYMLGLETDDAKLTQYLMGKINELGRKIEAIKEIANE